MYSNCGDNYFISGATMNSTYPIIGTLHHVACSKNCLKRMTAETELHVHKNVIVSQIFHKNEQKELNHKL